MSTPVHPSAPFGARCRPVVVVLAPRENMLAAMERWRGLGSGPGFPFVVGADPVGFRARGQ